MKKINVLILDDNYIIARKVKKRLFDADNSYRYDSGIQIYLYYLEIDNDSPEKAAKAVNLCIKENEIKYLLLDRGFGKIIDPISLKNEELEKDFLYKDNTVVGYNIEDLLKEINKIKKNGLRKIKGAIVYTYDDYSEMNKEGEVIREEIINELINILPKRCSIDVLLSYSTIYKVAGVDLYEGYTGEGVIKLGRKDQFVLYGIFIGELLYHKLLQMINIRKSKIIKEKQVRLFVRIIILYLIFVSINIGGNALYSQFFAGKSALIGLVSISFALLIPFIVLVLKPNLLIDIDE